jgi:hypothetical protein
MKHIKMYWATLVYDSRLRILFVNATFIIICESIISPNIAGCGVASFRRASNGSGQFNVRQLDIYVMSMGFIIIFQ